MRLFIAEKPSLGEAISLCLPGERKKHAGRKGPTHISVGNDVITWCFGHVYELCEPEDYSKAWATWTLETLPLIPSEWRLKPKVSARGQIKVIRELLAQCSEVIHAGDPDREGQLLVDEVLSELKNKKPVRRLWLSATDEKSVKKALTQLRPNEAYRGLKESAEARSQGDWLVGLNSTRLMTLLGQREGVSGVLSVGRVQTPTLALVTARDQAIENFRPRDFYLVIADIEARDQTFKARLVPSKALRLDEEERILDKDIAGGIAKKIVGKPACIKNYSSELSSEAPPLPFSLDKLQMAANKKLGLSAEKTLEIVQRLYEAKLISYPRTDSGYLPENQFLDAPSVLSQLSKIFPIEVQKSDCHLRSGAWNDKKVTAHHGIIPTGIIKSLEGSERTVFELIAKRYLSQFYPPYRFERVRIEIVCEGELLEAKGLSPITLGWREIFADAEDKIEENEEGKAILPRLEKGELCHCTAAHSLAKKTTPPPPYSEASLLSAMLNIQAFESNQEIKKRLKESAGIGTPATRAHIIETLKKRGYVTTRGKTLISTNKGRDLIRKLPPVLKSPGLTALFEQMLEEIAAGDLTKAQFLAKQSDFIRKIVKEELSHGK